MEQPAPGRLDFRTRTVGLLDTIWPVDNTYSTSYDTTTFVAKSYTKQIRQKKFQQNLKFVTDDNTGTINYDKTAAIRRPENVQTIFTMLAQVGQETPEQLDTRWFPMEHEGQPYRVRLLWAGSATIKIAGKSYGCNHYRLDIEPADGQKENILTRSDYFSEYIVHPDAMRQLWVESDGQRRIVQATVKLFGITLEAQLSDG